MGKGERIHKNAREVGNPYDMSFGDLLEKVHFGSFAVVLTSRGVLFETYTGYHVWTTPFVTDKDGVVREKSLYSWLINLVEFYHASKDHPDDPVEGISADADGNIITNSEMLEHLKVVTEANLMQPVSVFIDADRAVSAAIDYEKWLTDCYKKLIESSNKLRNVSDMDEMRAMAEIEGDVTRANIFKQISDELSDG